MKNTLMLAPPSAEPPVDNLETWARTFAFGTPTSDDDARYRRMVLHLLAELEASRG